MEGGVRRRKEAQGGVRRRKARLVPYALKIGRREGLHRRWRVGVVLARVLLDAGGYAFLVLERATEPIVELRRAEAGEALRGTQLLAAAVPQARDPFEARRVRETRRRLLLAFIEEARRVGLHLATLCGEVLEALDGAGKLGRRLRCQRRALRHRLQRQYYRQQQRERGGGSGGIRNLLDRRPRGRVADSGRGAMQCARAARRQRVQRPCRAHQHERRHQQHKTHAVPEEMEVAYRYAAVAPCRRCASICRENTRNAVDLHSTRRQRHLNLGDEAMRVLIAELIRDDGSVRHRPLDRLVRFRLGASLALRKRPCVPKFFY